VVRVSDEEFKWMTDEALATLPKEYVKGMKNVAILYERDVSPERRQQMKLPPNQTLFGLFEGITRLQQAEASGAFGSVTLPNRITLFIDPLSRSVESIPALKEQIRHTLWHEIAHYYGLDHKRIGELEGK